MEKHCYENTIESRRPIITGIRQACPLLVVRSIQERLVLKREAAAEEKEELEKARATGGIFAIGPRTQNCGRYRSGTELQLLILVVPMTEDWLDCPTVGPGWKRREVFKNPRHKPFFLAASTHSYIHSGCLPLGDSYMMLFSERHGIKSLPA